MRESIKLLLIYVAIGVITAGTTAYFLYQNRKEYWNEYVRSTFTEVLREDLQKRKVKDVPYVSWGVGASSNRNDSLKDNSFKEVLMISKDGEKKYQVPAFKTEHNIEDNFDMRMLQSYILEMHPLVADSLNFSWTESLHKMGFTGKNVVRVSAIDLLEQETKHYSNDSLVVNEADSLFSFYIGNRSEIEVTGFLYLPWWRVFFLKDIILLSGMVVICFFLPFLSRSINRLYHTYFIKTIIKTEIVTIEKPIPMIIAEKSEMHTYQLDTGVVFDYDSRELRRNGQSELLTHQIADLLKLFLEAEDYLLTTIEIAEAIWPNTMDAKNNIYSAIKKLRKNLSHISLCTVNNKNSTYQLKIPHSIGENG